MPLHVFDVVELWSQRVMDVDDNDLPVRLFFVQQGHDTKDFDLLDLASVADELADLADVEWVVVAFCFCFGMNYIGVLPCLWERTVSSGAHTCRSERDVLTRGKAP